MRYFRKLMCFLLLLSLLPMIAVGEAQAPLFCADEADYTFTILALSHSELWGSMLSVQCDNHSERTLSFALTHTSVMGYMMDPLWAVSVAPCGTEVSQISFSDDMLAQIGVDAPAEITFTLAVTAMDDADTGLIAEKEYTIHPLGAAPELMPYVPAEGEIVLADNEHVRFVLRSTETHPFLGYLLSYHLENRTDAALMITLADLTVNGTPIDPLWACELRSGKMACGAITLPDFALSNAGITEIAQIDFTLMLYAEGSWMTPLDEIPISWTSAE